MQPEYGNDLQSYFTDMEHPRDLFKANVSAERLPKHLIVFHGVGGVGKSSLLRMFRLYCKSEKIPAALTSGDEAKSALDILTRWTEDLKADGIKFSTFSKTWEAYRAIQAKVENQIKNSQNRVADIASKAAAKTAETAGGALVGTVIGSVIPGVGTAIGGAVGGVVGGMGAEALADWLRGFLSKPDIDLLLDPAKKLSVDFLDDIAKAGDKKRIVLLLDTFEQMSALEDWVGDIAQKIHHNILVVITGRKLPDWNRAWPGWMMNAHVEELKPMNEEIMRQLIHRYYATMRGGAPNPEQVEAIIHFARGLPMVVTSAVQLWVKYGVEDFQSVKAEIVANLVDRLMEGVPSALIPALEAASAVRWFNQPILRAVMKQDDVREVYNELRRFPFVRTRIEGLALHDSVREMIDENLRIQDSERHAELHSRAALYFERLLEKAKSNEVESIESERLYQLICSDENKGILLFSAMAEQSSRYSFVSRLRNLINDVNSFNLIDKNNQLWLKYYNGRLAYMDGMLHDAEGIYRLIGEDDQVEPRLRAYALCSWGTILSRWQRLGEAKGIEQALYVLNKGLEVIHLYKLPPDEHLITIYIRLAHVYRYQGDFDKSHEYNRQFLEYYRNKGEKYGLVDAYQAEKRISASLGEWRGMLSAHENGMRILETLPTYSSSKSYFAMMSAWAWVFMGRYTEIERHLKSALLNAVRFDDAYSIYWANIEIGLAETFQDKFDDAEQHFKDGLRVLEAFGSGYETHFAYVYGFRGLSYTRQSKMDLAQESLHKNLEIFEKYSLSPDIPQTCVWLGQLYETMKEYEQALNYYEYCLKLKWTRRNNFMSEALTGLIRIKHAQNDIAAIPPLLVEAEHLAQEYEYNNHLASLHLVQGHIACERGNQNEALSFYKRAMIYALRYNRFLLDELIGGRLHGTPLQPIIPYLLRRGEGGNTVLRSLREWWMMKTNDIGRLRSDTISPLPEGISLLDAEKFAREREIGDGSAQKTVIEQIGISI
jgi:tetratricopeptide (TPR) repeat protein